MYTNIIPHPQPTLLDQLHIMCVQFLSGNLSIFNSPSVFCMYMYMYKTLEFVSTYRVYRVYK